LFFTIGPPTLAPNWFRLNGFFNRREVVLRVHRLVAEKLDTSPWILLGARPRRDVQTAPELWPYSALSVELSTLNSATVLIGGWNVIWFWIMSFSVDAVDMKLTVSSRLPARVEGERALAAQRAR